MGHPEYRINVNLSVVQLLQNDIVERIRTVLEETKMRPENLTLERYRESCDQRYRTNEEGVE